MADNTTLNAGTGGDTIASDDVLGVKYQRVKISVGADGSAADNSTTAPLAVKISDGTDVALVDASGNLQVSLSGTAANGTAVKVDGSAVTQPVSIAATVTVDSELTTADLDTGAGTDTRAVVGLVLAESGGGLLVGSAHPIPISDNSGSLTVDNGGTFAVQAAQSGTWNITNVSGTVSLPTGAATAAKQPALGTAGTASADVITVQGIASMTALKVDGSGVTQPVSNAGTFATQATLQTGTNSVGKISDITTSVVPGTGATNLGKAEDAAHSSGDTGVMMLGVRETSPTDLSANTSNGDYEPVQVNRDGALWVVGAAGPTGGWSVATGTIGATKTDIGTANTAGQVGGWYFYNANASVAYVQFFNTQASGVTLGTTAPVYSLGIPATSAANIAPGMVGIAHSTAISIAITTTRSGSTGPGSTVDYNIWYKQ